MSVFRPKLTIYIYIGCYFFICETCLVSDISRLFGHWKRGRKNEDKSLGDMKYTLFPANMGIFKSMLT